MLLFESRPISYDLTVIDLKVEYALRVSNVRVFMVTIAAL